MAFWKVTGSYESYKSNESGTECTGGMFKVPEFFVEVPDDHLFAVSRAQEKAFAVLSMQSLGGRIVFVVEHEGQKATGHIVTHPGDVVQLRGGIARIA